MSEQLRSVRELLGLPKSYASPFFLHVWENWSWDRREHYEQRISDLLKGGPLTREAHEQAVRETNSKFNRGAPMFEGMRKAVG